MSWWRIILGTVLIILVLLISGLVSQRFAARGEFRLAEKLMIAPGWMEQYKPDTKAFIEAGVLYQDGDYEAAAEAFSTITTVDAAESMKSLSLLKLATEEMAGGNADTAYDVLTNIDFDMLSEDDTQEYLATCSSLYEYYLLAAGSGDQKCLTLQKLLDMHTEK